MGTEGMYETVDRCETDCSRKQDLEFQSFRVAIRVYYILQITAHRERPGGAPLSDDQPLCLPAQPRSRAKAERPRSRIIETYHKREERFTLYRTPLENTIQPSPIPCLRTLHFFQSLSGSCHRSPIYSTRQLSFYPLHLFTIPLTDSIRI